MSKSVMVPGDSSGVTPACQECATPLPQLHPLATESRVKTLQSAEEKPKAGEMFCIIYFSKKAEPGESIRPCLLGPTWEAGTQSAHQVRRESAPAALQRPKDNC